MTEPGISSKRGKKIKTFNKEKKYKKVTSCIDINTCKSINPFNYINVCQSQMRLSDPFLPFFIFYFYCVKLHFLHDILQTINHVLNRTVGPTPIDMRFKTFH